MGENKRMKTTEEWIADLRVASRSALATLTPAEAGELADVLQASRSIREHQAEALAVLEERMRRAEDARGRLATILDEAFGSQEVLGLDGLLTRLEHLLHERGRQHEAALTERDEARDCGQDRDCAVSPGCQLHLDRRGRELQEQVQDLSARLAVAAARACEVEAAREVPRPAEVDGGSTDRARRCETCVHADVAATVEPCASCPDPLGLHTRWEPACKR